MNTKLAAVLLGCLVTALMLAANRRSKKRTAAMHMPGRSLSPHERQMRYWAIGLILAALTLFAMFFYLLNQRLLASPPASPP